jgi:hypothetical protein
VPEILERRARALLDVVVTLSAAPRDAFRPAAADAPEPPKRVPRSLYLPLGVAAGVAVHDRAAGYVGVEASLVHVETPSLFWLGAYTDLLYDFGASSPRASLGPEMGVGAVGLDGGVLVEHAAGVTRYGFVLRPVLTLSWVALTGRIGWVGASNDRFGEVGLLFKIPTAL